MYKFVFKILIILSFLILPVYADSFDEIIIKGNKRISSETIKVFSDIPNNKIINVYIYTF